MSNKKINGTRPRNGCRLLTGDNCRAMREVKNDLIKASLCNNHAVIIMSDSVNDTLKDLNDASNYAKNIVTSINCSASGMIPFLNLEKTQFSKELSEIIFASWHFNHKEKKAIQKAVENYMNDHNIENLISNSDDVIFREILHNAINKGIFDPDFDYVIENVLKAITSLSLPVKFNDKPQITPGTIDVVKIDSPVITGDMFLTGLICHQCNNPDTPIDVYCENICNFSFTGVSPVQKILKFGNRSNLTLTATSKYDFPRGTMVGDVFSKFEEVFYFTPLSYSKHDIFRDLREKRSPDDFLDPTTFLLDNDFYIHETPFSIKDAHARYLIL